MSYVSRRIMLNLVVNLVIMTTDVRKPMKIDSAKLPVIVPYPRAGSFTLF